MVCAYVASGTRTAADQTAVVLEMEAKCVACADDSSASAT
jgi:hypothetical protein